MLHNLKTLISCDEWRILNKKLAGQTVWVSRLEKGELFDYLDPESRKNVATHIGGISVTFPTSHMQRRGAVRAAVVDMRNDGIPVTEIVRVTGLGRSTVYRIIT